MIDRTSQSRWPQIILAVVILAASLAAALRVRQSGPPEEAEHEPDVKPVPVAVAVVRAGEIDETLLVTGKLMPVPNGESRVAAQVSGRVDRVSVRPGQVVTAGQLLATIRRPDLFSLSRQSEAGVREAAREMEAIRSQRVALEATLPPLMRQADAELSAARARLERLQAGSRPEEVERAEAALQSAQAELDGLRAGSRPQEIAQAEAAVRDARAGRDALRKDAVRKRALFEKGIVAARDVERADADLATADANLESKGEALSLLRAGARPDQIRAQESKVREAAAQLKLARAGSRMEEIREAQAGVSAAEAGVEQARAAREELGSLEQRLLAARARLEAVREQSHAAREQAERAEVRSPLAGVVAQVLVNPGDGVAEQTAVAVILNRDAFRAMLEIPAARAGRTPPGTAAEITVPGMAGVRFRGVIRALLAGADPETGFVSAEVQLADPQHRLADGMAVNARLSKSGSKPGLLIPSRALFARDGEQFVYRIDGGEAHEVAVDVGREQGEETEILRGLRRGDRLVLDGSLSLADGVAVTIEP